MKNLVMILAFAFLGNGAQASSLEMIFGNVSSSTPQCFSREYSQSHMQKHPKQTVESIRVQLVRDERENLFGATVSLRQKSQRSVTRDLTCLQNGSKVVCFEDGCESPVELRNMSSGGNGLQVVNENFRIGGSCDGTPIDLPSLPGGDDVFDLLSDGVCN